MTTKIILDTDIGSDIDDAVCLAYLLAQPQCELMGITTVTGQPIKRAEMCSVLCKGAGKDIPIYPGCADPILIPQRQPEVPQAPGVEKWPHQTEFPKGEAIEFLRRTIRQNPGEVILLTIGPLTNAGLLFAVDPEVAPLLKGLVMMGGLFNKPPEGWPATEWNAAGDPHATARVYRTPVKMHRSIGLDVTIQVKLESREVKEKFKAPLLKPVLDFYQHWFGGEGPIIFHDPLAAATLFDDTICRFERGQVAVELQKEEELGLTRWTPDGVNATAVGPHEIAVSVDVERFFEQYFSVF